MEQSSVQFRMSSNRGAVLYTHTYLDVYTVHSIGTVPYTRTYLPEVKWYVGTTVLSSM